MVFQGVHSSGRSPYKSERLHRGGLILTWLDLKPDKHENLTRGILSKHETVIGLYDLEQT